MEGRCHRKSQRYLYVLLSRYYSSSDIHRELRIMNRKFRESDNVKHLISNLSA